MPHFFRRCWSWIQRDALLSWLISRYPKPQVEEPTETAVQPVVKTETELLIEKWKALDLSKIDRVFSSDMSMVHIEVRHGRVRDYRKYLRNITNCYKRDTSCHRPTVVIPRESHRLSTFFLDEKDYYLDPVKETLLLQEEVTAFLEYYNEVAKDSETSYSKRFNNNITRSLIVELADLQKVLSL